MSSQGSVVSRNGRLVVEMVNNNDRSVTLKAGQMYGTAGPIDVIEGWDITVEIEANFVNEGISL